MSRHQQNLTKAIHGQVLSRWKRELLWKQSIPQNYANSYYFITNVFYWDLQQDSCLEIFFESCLFPSLSPVSLHSSCCLFFTVDQQKWPQGFGIYWGTEVRGWGVKLACASGGSVVVTAEQQFGWVPPASPTLEMMVMFHFDHNGKQNIFCDSELPFWWGPNAAVPGWELLVEQPAPIEVNLGFLLA